MYLRKFRCLYGEHAQTFCLLEITCIAERLILIHGVSSAASNWSLLRIYFGSVRLQGMNGHFAEEKFRNVQIMFKTFFMLFRCLIDRLSQQELEQWAVTTWAIWNARNKYYFEHIQTHPKSILDGAIGFLQEYQRLVAAQSHD